MRRTRASLRAAAVAALLAADPAVAAEPLPSFNVDLAQTSVSGLSSGAYMAGQFHMAFSGTVIGAGIVAGGPYGCAEGQIAIALSRCMETTLGSPDPEQLVARARALAEEGRIDPLEELVGDRVYLFSGTKDETVTQQVVDSAAALYRLAGLPDAAIEFIDDRPAGHGFITDNRGSPCGTTASPFLIDCDYDQAGALLKHILGPLNPPGAPVSGTHVEFDQVEFLSNATAHGMAPTGFAYIPEDCTSGERCRVHVAFHGCRQTYARVDDAFVKGAGYNRWAETNRLIILYPQAHETLLNPNACWDWWGYDDPAYATKSGRQMAAVRAMVTRLAGDVPPEPFCEIHAGFNFDHWRAGRARFCAWWQLCAVGSGEVLGFAVNGSTLYESPPGHFGTEPCGN